MTVGWILAFVALWILVVMLAVAFAGTLRRIGAVLEAAEQSLQTRVPNHGIAVGSRLPWFEGTLVDGSAISAGEFEDASAVLLFLSGGCMPCHQLASQLQATSERDLRPELWVVVREQKDLEELGLEDVKVILQPGGSIQQAFQTTATPHAFAIKNGVITAAGHPNTIEALLELANEIQEGGDSLSQPSLAHQPA